MSLEEIEKNYYSDCSVVEITDQAEITKMIESKASCCWGAGQVINEGWVQLCQHSKTTENDKNIVFICRQENIPA